MITSAATSDWFVGCDRSQINLAVVA